MNARLEENGGEFRTVLISNALAETGRSAEELIAVFGGPGLANPNHVLCRD